MLSLLLAFTTAAATTSAAQAEAPTPSAVHMRTIAWSVFGVEQSVRVTSDDSRPWELALESHTNTWLRSIVGPFFSTVQFREPDAAGEHHTARIVTRIDSETSFDLVNWLDSSGQSGPVLAQLLTGPRCSMEGACEGEPVPWPEHPHCPSEASVRSWDGGTLELSRMLVASECFSDAQIGIQADAFWVDDWEAGTVTLAVQREHCLDTTAQCHGEVSFVDLAPPKAWRPWLDAAAKHRGHLARLAPSQPAPEPTPSNEPSLTDLPSLARR
jgi:hypothetical protein